MRSEKWSENNATDNSKLMKISYSVIKLLGVDVLDSTCTSASQVALGWLVSTSHVGGVISCTSIWIRLVQLEQVCSSQYGGITRGHQLHALMGNGYQNLGYLEKSIFKWYSEISPFGMVWNQHFPTFLHCLVSLSCFSFPVWISKIHHKGLYRIWLIQDCSSNWKQNVRSNRHILSIGLKYLFRCYQKFVSQWIASLLRVCHRRQ